MHNIAASNGHPDTLPAAIGELVQGRWLEADTAEAAHQSLALSTGAKELQGCWLQADTAEAAFVFLGLIQNVYFAMSKRVCLALKHV
jgi:hypothetical protein